MRRLLPAIGAAALAFAMPSTAQPTADPARLAAAHAVVDAAMPPAVRDGMTQNIMKPMLDNIRAAFAASPQMKELTARRPQAQAVLDRFLAQVVENTGADLKAAMPRLMEAMAGAYARNLTLAQLNDTRAFYESPAGRALVASLPAITADPGVVEVQRQMLTAALARLPEQGRRLQAELAALDRAKP